MYTDARHTMLAPHLAAATTMSTNPRPLQRFESLPVELIAEILGELDVSSLLVVAYLSRRLHSIAADSSLNPWRKPILRNLRRCPEAPYEAGMRALSTRHTVPRQNWLEILARARAEWLLFEATLPNLGDAEWEACFGRRFLPGWRKWKKDGSWRQAFMKCVSVQVVVRATCGLTEARLWQGSVPRVAPGKYILHF